MRPGPPPPATAESLESAGPSPEDVALSCYGTTKIEAADLAENARTALLAAPTDGPDPTVVIDGAVDVVLTSVTVNSPNWLPDEDWPFEGRPGPRYLVQVAVTAHP